ncbi:hypothetical protein CesoFtcFv8_017590 [Champsocephalus esox]|uniref:Uncharacterized protein n=1 Tax=Champsocephalus esox TaxID=159716 RepID=A0AAN8GQE3_9TELE|nr:hypothetical protein CesoFtcFv8_017590 [Champsocephalus esox]
MLEAFLSKYPERRTELEALQVNCQSKDLTAEEWNTTKERADTIQAAFQVYLKEKASLSQSFDYWNTYVSDLYPIVRDLTNPLRSGDWILYCRWTPLFLQDCYQLKDKFPLLYDSYMHGGFVVNTTKKGSGVPFDQALEQCYNRPAKVSGGIIGITRKKEAVALWGIIKHKKDQYVDLLKMKDDVEEELSLHHDFNPSTATKIVGMVQDIAEYLLKVCSPLQDQVALKNILTGGIVTNVDIDKLLCCMKEGSAACSKFIDERLRNRSISIHSSLKSILRPLKFTSPKTTLNLAPKVDIKDETIKALMFIEYGCHQGFTVEELLQHEITNSAFLLVDKDGYLRKSAKSQLRTELLKLCPLIDKKRSRNIPTNPRHHYRLHGLGEKGPLKEA